MKAGPHRVALATPQLAFVRAWAEGIDPVIAWTRFLQSEGAGDARSARRELGRLLEELRRIARLHGRADLAALLLRDPEAMVERDSRRPSLEGFRRGFDEDFYSESELLRLYEERYGRPDARSSARRRQRLRERLLEALQWLQERAVRSPRPDDATGLWFDPELARRLSRVGILSLAELRFWVATKGFHWYQPIPRLGRTGALKIVRWLREHEDGLGALPAPSLQPRHALDLLALAPSAQAGIVPIERLLLPDDERCGRGAGNRASPWRCKLEVETDLEAVLAWLATQPTGSNTWRAYRRESERWLLWAVFERRLALSALDGADCDAYRRFLAAPPAHWTSPRHTPRWSTAWRPMEGSLGSSSRRTAEAILRTLCDWLVRRAYLASNPWDEAHDQHSATASAAPASLKLSDLEVLDDWLDAEARTPARLRLRCLQQLAGRCGIPLSELAAASLSWLCPPGEADPGSPWTLRIPRTRAAAQLRPLSQPAVSALEAYLAARGLVLDSRKTAPETPLLANLGDGTHLSSVRLRKLLLSALRACALALYPDNKLVAQRLQQATARDLRVLHS